MKGFEPVICRWQQHLAWFTLVTNHDKLFKVILQGKVEEGRKSLGMIMLEWIECSIFTLVGCC